MQDLTQDGGMLAKASGYAEGMLAKEQRRDGLDDLLLVDTAFEEAGYWLRHYMREHGVLFSVQATFSIYQAYATGFIDGAGQD